VAQEVSDTADDEKGEHDETGYSSLNSSTAKRDGGFGLTPVLSHSRPDWTASPSRT
jgi:hypothetical protein